MYEEATVFSVLEGNTKGKITELNGKIRDGRWFIPADRRWASYEVGREVFRTIGEAEVVARNNAATRIKSLERSLAKMRKNPFAPAHSGAPQ